MDLSSLREEYARARLDREDLAADPLEQFDCWMREAQKVELLEPNAMVLATADRSGQPWQRTVLLKSFDERGFVFYTNLESRKSQQIRENAAVSLLFLWLPLQRQLAIQGTAERLPPREVLKYFLSRPLGSRLGAWSSPQSQVISSRSLLEKKWDEMRRKFSGGEIPLPDFWGGFRVQAERFEFWQGRPNRLHDRFEYLREGQGWTLQRLAP